MKSFVFLRGLGGYWFTRREDRQGKANRNSSPSRDLADEWLAGSRPSHWFHPAGTNRVWGVGCCIHPAVVSSRWKTAKHELGCGTGLDFHSKSAAASASVRDSLASRHKIHPSATPWINPVSSNRVGAEMIVAPYSLPTRRVSSCDPWSMITISSHGQSVSKARPRRRASLWVCKTAVIAGMIRFQRVYRRMWNWREEWSG